MTDLILRLVAWLVRQVGLRTLLIFGLLALVMLTVAGGVQGLAYQLNDAPFVAFTLLALVCSWLLAKSRWAGWQAGLLAALLGLATILLDTAKAWIKLLALAQASLQFAGQWLQAAWLGIKALLTPGVQPGAAPPDASLIALLLQDISHSLAAVLGRAQAWVGGLLRGSPGFDLVAATLVWGLALWAVAVWAAWFVRRRSQPLVAILPAAVLLTGSLAFVGKPALILAPVAFGAFMLLTVCNLGSQQDHWHRAGLDYAEDINFDMGMWATGLVTLTLVLALLVSYISPQKIFENLRQLAQGRSQETTALGESLGLPSKPEEPVSAVPADPGVLPRQHLLGSGTELSQEIVMIVQVEGILASTAGDSLPAPEYYWRSLVYDSYTGRGWVTSQTQSVAYRAGQPAQSSASPGYRRLRQRVQWLTPPMEALYFTGSLVSADLDFQVTERPASQPGNDIFAAAPLETPSGNTYNVDSLALQVGITQLRAAGAEYPQWVVDRYLLLPADLPPRLFELAGQITAQAATPYDRALAIEHYLRAFPYNLDIPAPPPDRDVVDYFLFDLRQGYCDYYASAMVVLARAAGMPARLVTGYAPGSYDPRAGRFVVTADNAHSWPEIYFPGAGWVEFEPTSSRPEFQRPEDLTPPPASELGETPAISRLAWQTIFKWLGWAAALAAGLGMLAILWALVDTWRIRRLGPQGALQALYRRMYQHGLRLEVDPPPGETPHEFAGQLSQRLSGLSVRPRWQKYLAPAGQESSQLVDLYTRSVYGPLPAGRPDQDLAMRAWRGLSRRLWLARWLALRWPRRSGKKGD